MLAAASPADSSSAKAGPAKRKFSPAARSIAPSVRLFPDGFRNETQVIALVFSADKENDPDVVGINAAAARWLFPTFLSAPPLARCVLAA